MNDQMFDDLRLEKLVHAQFGLAIEVDTVIARNFPVSRNDTATLFLSSKKQLYVYISGQSRLLLSDVRKVVSKIGLKAESYVPPKGRPQYFDEVGLAKFKEVFPGRTHVTEADLAFYRTLSPYSPALVLVSDVKDGAVYQFDPDTLGGWRLNVKFSYRRIRTS